MVSTIVLMALTLAPAVVPFEGEGSLELVIYDAPDGDTRVDAYLVQPGQPPLLLHDVFGDVLPQPGVVLHVSGTREGDALWVSEVDVVEPAFELASVGASAGPMVRTLNAVMVGFQTQPLDTSPEQVQQLREYFFGERIDSVASYYAEVSYGKFQFVGDVFIVNLPIDNPSGPRSRGHDTGARILDAPITLLAGLGLHGLRFPQDRRLRVLDQLRHPVAAGPLFP